jgi:hypothetical protein
MMTMLWKYLALSMIMNALNLTYFRRQLLVSLHGSFVSRDL